jgi:hypothetical protein
VKLLPSVLAIAIAASPAWASPATQVFPLNGSELPPQRRGTSERLTRALADSIDGEVSSVSIEDAAGLLECDVESTNCLEAVSKSIGNKQLVFGTIKQGSGSTLKVTLTRFRPGPDRAQQTYLITGQTEAYPDELVRKAAPLFDGKAPRPIEPTPDRSVPTEPRLTAGNEPDRKAPAGAISAGTWGLIGGGAASILVGVGFRISAGGLRDDVANAPRETTADFARLTSLEDKGKLHATLGAVFMTGGAIALGAGIVRAVMQHEQPRREADDVVTVTPIAGGAAIVLTWGMR